MDLATIIAIALATITDRILTQTCPEGTNLDEWRAEVQAKADNEEAWLGSILGKGK